MDKIAKAVEINKCIDAMVNAYVWADRSFRSGCYEAAAKYQQKALVERNRLYKLVGREDMQFMAEEEE